MLARLLPVLLSTCLAPACLAPAPSEAVPTPVGVVRADDAGTAQHYAQMLQALHPRVRAALPGALDRPTELWVQEVLKRWKDEAHRDEAMGFTILGRDLRPGRIHLRANTAYPAWYLTHELGHALMGPTWKALPGVLSEGVCDWLAAELNPELAATIQTHRLLHASLFFGGMSYEVDYTHPESGEERRTEIWYTYDPAPETTSPTSVLQLDRWNFHTQDAVPVSHYGLGFLVVSRIAERHGLEHLHELCVRASEAELDVVPTEWILAAAGIEGPGGWSTAARSLLGRREFYEVARILPAVFHELPAMAFEDRFPQFDAVSLLREVNPRVALADGSQIPLAEVEPRRTAARAERSTAQTGVVATRSAPAAGSSDAE